jgi:hypothetical protein
MIAILSALQHHPWFVLMFLETAVFLVTVRQILKNPNL